MPKLRRYIVYVLNKLSFLLYSVTYIYVPSIYKTNEILFIVFCVSGHLISYSKLWTILKKLAFKYVKLMLNSILCCYCIFETYWWIHTNKRAIQDHALMNPNLLLIFQPFIKDIQNVFVHSGILVVCDTQL